jgi:hypothetical protein
MSCLVHFYTRCAAQRHPARVNTRGHLDRLVTGRHGIRAGSQFTRAFRAPPR